VKAKRTKEEAMLSNEEKNQEEKEEVSILFKTT